MINIKEIKNLEEIKETSAFKFEVAFAASHTPNEKLKVSFDELKSSKAGKNWFLEGSWDKLSATVLYIDAAGALVRFSKERFDEQNIAYNLKYFHFLK